MNNLIFSLCALSLLHASDVVDPYEEFLAEELPLEELPADWAEEEALCAPVEATPALAEKVEYVAEVPGEVFCDPDSAELYQMPAKTTVKAQPLADPMLLADNNTPSMPSPATAEDNNSFLSIGGTYAYTHIKPHGNPSFHGHLGGVQALYEYRPCNRIYGGLKLSWRQGEISESNTSRFLIDATAEERIGYTAAIDKDRWLWTVFTGLGYRFLGYHLRQSDSVKRINYSEFYCPVGLFTDYQVESYFSMGLHATWMPQIFPTVTIAPLGGARWATSYRLGNILVEAPFSFFMGAHKQFFLTLTPTFQYWQNGHTTAKTSTGEALGFPGNTYFFWGADLSLGYAF